jgi:hypothetical protein
LTLWRQSGTKAGMITKSDVLAAYGGNGAAVARAIGRTKQAVHWWSERIPLESAIRLAAVDSRFSLHDLRPDLFPAPNVEQESEAA